MESFSIYCDGSCNNRNLQRPGGWGVVIYNSCDNVVGEYSGGTVGTSSNRMELIAMITAVQLANCLKSEGKVIIYSDSMYAVNSANLPLTSVYEHMPNFDLINVLVVLRQKATSVFIFHVKGHNGTTGNERAHQLAHNEFQKQKQALLQ